MRTMSQRSMITGLPHPYPDELLYSLLARAQHRKQYPNQRQFIQEVFGTGNVTAVLDFPSHLDNLVSRLPPGNDYSVDHVIDQMTLLPFYAPFLPAHRLQRLRADMRGTNGQSIHTRLGLIASRVPVTQWFNACPQCVAADQAHWGECYWHRVHQLEVVYVCPIHAVPLSESTLSARSNRTRYVFVCAEEVLQAEPSSQQPIEYPRQIHEALLAIARESAWLLSQTRVDTSLRPSVNVTCICWLNTI